jgi:hypothetical protein
MIPNKNQEQRNGRQECHGDGSDEGHRTRLRAETTPVESDFDEGVEKSHKEPHPNEQFYPSRIPHFVALFAAVNAVMGAVNRERYVVRRPNVRSALDIRHFCRIHRDRY